MKYLAQTTGALLFAGAAVLFGGCDSSVSPSATVIAYKMDQQDPAAQDASNLTMETAETAVDPDQEKYVQKYNQMKAARPVAAPRPAAKPAPQLPPPLASKEDIAAAKARVADLKGTVKTAKNGAIIGVHVESADTTLEDMQLIGRLADLESVFFLGANFNDEMLAPLADLKKLTSVTVQNSDITVKTLEMFATYPELKTLDLRRDLKLDNKDLAVVAGMPKLETLRIYYNSFSNAGLNRVAKSTTLKSVDVRACEGVSDSGAKYLARLATLEEVYFRFLITNDGVKHLEAAPNLRFIEFQDCNDLTEACVESLKKMPNLTGLRMFRDKGFGDAAVQALGDMKLERLELRDLNVSNDGILALKGMGADSLKVVELSELPSVDTAGLNELLAAWTSPTTLNIFSLPATDETVKTIATALPNLKSLTLRATQITDASIDELLKLQNIETLDLRENGELTADAMLKLAQIKTLKKIYVKGSGLGATDAEAQRAQFKKTNPKCAISN